MPEFWETYNVVEAAYQKNLLIMGFENILYHRELVTEECIFSNSEAEKMVQAMKVLVNYAGLVQEQLVRQQGKMGMIWENLRRLT